MLLIPLLEALAWSQGKSLSDLDYQFLAASQEFDRREVETWLQAERTKEVKARLIQEQKVARFQRLFFIGAFSWALIIVLGLVMVTFEYKKPCPAKVNVSKLVLTKTLVNE